MFTVLQSNVFSLFDAYMNLSVYTSQQTKGDGMICISIYEQINDVRFDFNLTWIVGIAAVSFFTFLTMSVT